MLLRNYDVMNIHRNISIQTNETFGESSFTDGNLYVKTFDGVLRASCTGYGYSQAYFGNMKYNIGSAYNAAGCVIVCGSNNDPVSYDDYTLKGYYSSQVSPVSSGSGYYNKSYDEATGTFSCDYQCNFTATEDVTIREIGIVGTNGNSGNSVSTNELVLYYREVLEKEINVTAGQFFKITVHFTIPGYINKPADYQASVSVE